MTTVTLYWSNICILHRWEKARLELATAILAERGIDLRTRYFGIGYPTRMAATLAEPDAEIPDLIVSTDLEVFEDCRIFNKFGDDLHELKELIPLKAEIEGHALSAWPGLLPFLVIPLVFCSNANYAGPGDISYEDLLAMDGVAFGGAGNSAARTVLKTLWDRYGGERALAFAHRARITQMPVEAFQQVRQGGAMVCVAPSIYAKSANGSALRRHYPKEGAIALPSYIAAHKKAPLETIQQVLNALLTAEFCDYFVNEGSLYCPLAGTAENGWVAEHGTRFLYPSQEFFALVPPERFADAYRPLQSV
jgi:hypothetical protein